MAWGPVHPVLSRGRLRAGPVGWGMGCGEHEGLRHMVRFIMHKPWLRASPLTQGAAEVAAPDQLAGSWLSEYCNSVGAVEL